MAGLHAGNAEFVSFATTDDADEVAFEARVEAWYDGGDAAELEILCRPRSTAGLPLGPTERESVRKKLKKKRMRSLEFEAGATLAEGITSAHILVRAWRNATIKLPPADLPRPSGAQTGSSLPLLLCDELTLQAWSLTRFDAIGDEFDDDLDDVDPETLFALEAWVRHTGSTPVRLDCEVRLLDRNDEIFDEDGESIIVCPGTTEDLSLGLVTETTPRVLRRGRFQLVFRVGHLIEEKMVPTVRLHRGG